MELYPIDIAIHLCNIVVLYILLRILIWKPVRKFMAARTDRIQKDMDRAKELQAKAEQAKADYDSRLADVQATCEQMITDGRKKAQAVGQQTIDEAKVEAGHILTQARNEAAQEKQRAMDNVKDELVDLAVDMAGRVLRFDDETRKNLLADAPKVGSRKGVLKLAAPCNDEQLASITDRLEHLLGCHLELTTEIDNSLIGGFVGLVDGKVYDFSYAAQLSAMQQKLA